MWGNANQQRLSVDCRNNGLPATDGTIDCKDIENKW